MEAMLAHYGTLQRLGHRYACVIGAASLVVLTLGLFFWNSGEHSISATSDEVIYVRVTQGIFHDGFWFPLRHGHTPSFEKPPLKIWLNAAVLFLFGESNSAYRLLDALLGCFAVALSVGLAFRIFGSCVAACSVGLLTLAMPEWIISHHSFRTVVLDGLLTVLTLAIAWCAWAEIKVSAPAKRGSGGLIIIGVLSSLAVMTKSVAGFVPLACAVVSIGVTHMARLKTKHSLFLLLPFLVFAGYLVILVVVGGVEALRIFLGVEIFDRALAGFTGHNTGRPAFYGWYLFVRGAAAPHMLLALGTIGACIGAHRNLRYRFVLVWSFAPVLLYSCSASRVPWYLNPFLPFVCMVAVFGTLHLTKVIHDGCTCSIARWVILALIILLPIGSSISHFARAIERHMRIVFNDTKRLELDLLIARLREEGHPSYTVVGDSISGRSNPIQGRFNVEGIYRQSLKPDLYAEPDPAAIHPEAGRVFFVREDQLAALPQGWSDVGRAAPYAGRRWSVVAVEYK